jgi:hypothetical protein
MFGTRKREDAVMDTISKYSFIDGLPERVKGKIEEFSEKHAPRYENRGKAVSFFAKRLGEDYIVRFMHDNIRNPYTLDVFDAIAHACMKSMDELTMYENQLVDRKLARMLRAVDNLGSRPEEQYRLLKIFANIEGSSATELRRERN